MNQENKTNNAAVIFKDVTVTLGGVQILDSVNAVVPKESSTAIIGPNGAGKTTLLMALLGQVAYKGSIETLSPHGRDRVQIGYVPQHLDFDRGMPLTVLEFMVMGRQRRPLWFGPRRKRRRRALEVLESVAVAHLAQRRLGALSGGELQRVLLALALQQEPELLVLDEPSAGVDIVGGRLFCDLLELLQKEKHFTQIMVSHDLSIVTAHATHVICLNRRVTGQGSASEALRSEVLEATFGIHRGLPDVHGLHETVGGHARGPQCDCEERPHV